MVEESIEKFSLTRLLCISLQGSGANINRIDRNLIYIYKKNVINVLTEDKIYSKACMMFFNYYLYPQKTIRCFTKETRAVNAVTFYV